MFESLREIHVNIGEVKVGSEGDRLKTILGSCVGIAFIWRRKRRAALAHCLLPEPLPNLTSYEHNEAKFVSSAIPALIRVLGLKKENYADVEVYVAGGANMMAQIMKSNIHHVGGLNLEAARKYLKSYGFRFREIDIEGEEGRQMIVDCVEFEVSVKKLQRAS